MSAAEAWPTEAAATAAVDAVARKAFDDARQATAEATRIPIEKYADWEHCGPVVQLQWRERVLPLVWATIAALPDPRHAAWAEGNAAGRSDGIYEEVGFGPNPSYPHENPYPSGL